MLGLQRKQYVEWRTPTLGAAPLIGRGVRSNDGGGRFRWMAGTITSLASALPSACSPVGLQPRGMAVFSGTVTQCNGSRFNQALPVRMPFLSGVAGGKLFLFLKRRPWVSRFLFAVGAGPPQDGVRRTRRLNLSRDLKASLPPVPDFSTRSPRPSSPRERRGSALSSGNWNLFGHAPEVDTGACLPQRHSLPSAHMRCRITANLRATATRARAMPRRLAMFMPQARKADHLVLRISSEWAAS